MLIQSYYDTVAELRGILADWDQAAGDGDFGDNLTDGLRLAVGAIPLSATLGEEFRLAGITFLDDVGGTSGPLIGLLFDSIARATATGDGSIGERVWRGLTAGLASIQRVGDAEVGDRTMVDVLEPVLAEQTGTSGSVDWARAVASAWAAASRTSDMVAHRGRASYVGERAIGIPDPGAMAMALLFWTIAKHLDKAGGQLVNVPDLIRHMHARVVPGSSSDTAS